MRLEGKIALITGAGAGIGEATALLFAKEGAKKVADQIGENAFAVAADVAKSSDVEAMVKAGAEHFGGLDILVNNAGFGTLGTVVTLEEDLWDSIIDVNLKGVFLCSK
ncbi:MAG: SDR family oxidoreductase, partial [Acinetobacter baumannii]